MSEGGTRSTKNPFVPPNSPSTSRGPSPAAGCSPGTTESPHSSAYGRRTSFADPSAANPGEYGGDKCPEPPVDEPSEELDLDFSFCPDSPTEDVSTWWEINSDDRVTNVLTGDPAWPDPGSPPTPPPPPPLPPPPVRSAMRGGRAFAARRKAAAWPRIDMGPMGVDAQRALMAAAGERRRVRFAHRQAGRNHDGLPVGAPARQGGEVGTPLNPAGDPDDLVCHESLPAEDRLEQPHAHLHLQPELQPAQQLQYWGPPPAASPLEQDFLDTDQVGEPGFEAPNASAQDDQESRGSSEADEGGYGSCGSHESLSGDDGSSRGSSGGDSSEEEIEKPSDFESDVDVEELIDFIEEEEMNDEDAAALIDFIIEECAVSAA